MFGLMFGAIALVLIVLWLLGRVFSWARANFWRIAFISLAVILVLFYARPDLKTIVFTLGEHRGDKIVASLEGNTVSSEFQVITILLETPVRPGWQRIYLVDEERRPLTIHKGDKIHFWAPNSIMSTAHGVIEWSQELLVSYEGQLVTFEKNGQFFLKDDWKSGGPDIPTRRRQEAPYGVPGRPLLALADTRSSREDESLEFFSSKAGKWLIGMTIEHSAKCQYNYKAPNRSTPTRARTGTFTTLK